MYINLIFLSSLSVFAQKDQSLLLFRVEYNNKKVEDEESIGYAIINVDSFFRIREFSQFPYDPPAVLFIITKNGGHYTWDSFYDFDLYSCCTYGNVSKPYLLDSQDSISMVLGGYNDINIIDGLQYSGCQYIEENDTVLYKITYWRILAEYCLCRPYMGGATQPVGDHRLAYIKKINFLGPMSRRKKEKIKKIIFKILHPPPEKPLWK